MTRFLLTLLALLTGLAAQVSPAQARVCGLGDVEIGAVEGSGSSARVAVQSSQVSGPVARIGQRGRSLSCSRTPRKPVYIPSVQLRIDRAHE
jgi:hypothetical protein